MRSEATDEGSSPAHAGGSPLPKWKTPPPADGRSEYTARMASGAEDLRRAQALRFEVFNLELHEGLQTSYETRLDSDIFDPVCDHLIVEERHTGVVVGTYRLQTGISAARNLGYYSAQEFDFTAFEPERGRMVELGRACVDRNHRNMTVIQLLWKGIAGYALSRQARFLIGCSSLTSQDARDGADAYRQLQPHLAEPGWRTEPIPRCVCPRETMAVEPVKIPKLLLAYLSLGAKICGPPALDREFKTIDFLTLLDLEALPRKAVSKYLS